MAYTTATVNAWYQAVQFQNGPTATVNSWVSGLNAGTVTPGQVQNSIITQDSYTLGVVNPVLRLYQSSFNSVPDQAGQAYWVGQFGSGAQTYAQIANGFANSTQFMGIYANTSATQIANQAQVTLLYQNILQRAPDTAGLAYWTTQTIGTALAGISSSAEMVIVSALPIQNFQAAEIAGTASGSGSLYNYPGFPATTVALTTGIDTVSVTNGSTVVTGTANGSGATFNAGDSINFNSTARGQFNLNDLSTSGATTWTPTSVAGATVTASPSGQFAATFNGTNAVNANTASSAQGYVGLSALTINSAAQGAAVDVITAAATTDVVVNDIVAAVVTQNLTVNGGKTVTINENNSTFANAARTITVNGVAGTTSASVVQTNGTGATSQKVVISDVNGASATLANTISSVTIGGLNDVDDATAAVITTTALTNLTINNVTPTAGQTKTVVITNAAGTATANTTLALTLNNAFTAPTVTQLNYALQLIDTNNEITTLNITTGSTASTIATGVTASQLDINSTASTGLKTITVAGSSQLILGSLGNETALTSISVSGAAGLSTDVSGLGAKVTSITNTNSGTAINDFIISNTLQSYSHTGSSRDIITIGGRTTKTITAGSATNNTIFANYNSSAGQNVTNGGTVTGFTVLGLSTGSQGTFDLSAITGITSVYVLGAVAGATTISGAAPTTTLGFGSTSAANFTFNTTGSAGASSALNLTLGIPTTSDFVTNGLLAATTGGITVGGNFTAADASGNGIGTLNVAAYGTTAGTNATITTLVDTKLSALNISGTAALTIGTFTSGTSASLTINNTSAGTGTSAITTLTDASLTSLSFTGTGRTTIGTLTASTQPSLTINQNSTGTTAITTLTDTGLSSLTFTGANALTIGTLNTDSALLTIANSNTATSGLTITNLDDDYLSTLNITGTGNQTITTLTDILAGALTILDSTTGNTTITNMTAVSLTSLTAQNSGGGTMIIGDTTGNNVALVSINLLGDVQYTNTRFSGTVGYTVNGVTDNANVAITVSGTTAAFTTNTITLGDGNNTISNASQNAAAIALITLGNGNNTVTTGVGLSTVKLGTGSNTVNNGADAVADQTWFTTANGGSASSFTAVTNFATADTLQFANAAINTTITNLGTVGSVAAGVSGYSTTAGYTTFTVGTDTYVFQNTGTSANDQLVETIGAHTYTVTSTTLLTFLS